MNNPDEEFNTVPVYAEARYYFFKRNMSPFLNFRFGTSVVTNRNRSMRPYVAGAVGYSVGRFDIGVMYQFEKFKAKCDESSSYNRHHFSLNLGFHF